MHHSIGSLGYLHTSMYMSPRGFLGERIAYEGEVCYSKLLVVCALL